MKPNYIYVFSEISRDKLIDAGYKMLGSPGNGVWLFAENTNAKQPVDLLDRRDYYITNLLTFAGVSIAQ